MFPESYLDKKIFQEKYNLKMGKKLLSIKMYLLSIKLHPQILQICIPIPVIIKLNRVSKKYLHYYYQL